MMRLVVFLAACLAACSAAPATKPPHATGEDTCAVAWSCVRLDPATQAPTGCVEGDASQRPAFEASCTLDRHGVFALNPCLRDNLGGGCTVARGGTCTTTWYQAPARRTSIEATCAKQGASFVAP